MQSFTVPPLNASDGASGGASDANSDAGDVGLIRSRVGRVTQVQFSVFSPQQIRRLSVAEVTESGLYIRSFPRDGGLNDLRMGTTDRRFHCSTCKNDMIRCSGHLGHIELATPVYHTGYMSTILKILRAVCFLCSRVKVGAADGAPTPPAPAEDGLEALTALSKVLAMKTQCEHCAAPQPTFKRSGYTISATFLPDTPFANPEEAAFCARPLTASIVWDIFRRIPDADACRIGLHPATTRPEWLVLHVLVVPPPIIRPSIMPSDGSRVRGQDDITCKLQDIVKSNNALRRAVTERDTRVHYDALQSHVALYVHRDSKGKATQAGGGGGGAPKPGNARNNRKLRLVFDRLKGKKGRIRWNLQGKRVNFSGRSVVSPDPVMDIDCLGVPAEIGRALTVPVRVTHFNAEEMTACLRRGPQHPRGAASITLSNGTVLDLSLMAPPDIAGLRSVVGWTIERFLADGDWVIFNRQPSLHKQSMMAHRVQLIPGKSFRLSLCNTTPYNADFDGDEMNVHSMRTLPAVAELQTLMCVENQIMTAQNNKPIIGLVMDSIIAGYLMTRRDAFFTREEACQLSMAIHYPLKTFCARTGAVFPTASAASGASADSGRVLPIPAVLKPIPLWTGKQIFSLLFPPGLRHSMGEEEELDPNDAAVHIARGQLLAGCLCKKALGATANGIIHTLCNDLGPPAAMRFISDAQRLLVAFMSRRGFSMGPSDCAISQPAAAAVAAVIAGDVARSVGICAQVSEGALQEEAVEEENKRMLQGLLVKTHAVVQPELRADNSLVVMVKSGAKGSAINIAQICCCVGQQSVEGRRIGPGRNGRTLSSFIPESIAPQARGLVENSYTTGLNPSEFFLHAMGGREGLVDTAVKTASTGYIQRRITKALESLRVAYDGTVRDSRNHVVQFVYGGNGLDASRLERVELWVLHASNAAIRQALSVPYHHLCALLTPSRDIEAMLAEAFSAEELEEALEAEASAVCAGRDALRAGRSLFRAEMSATLYLPLNLRRVLQCARDRQGSGRRSTDLHPLRDALPRLAAMYREIQEIYHSAAATDVPAALLAYIRAEFSLRAIYFPTPLTTAAFQWAVTTVLRQAVRGRVCPAEMVGAVAASSIGEPTTQMTLNTFHYSGIAAKNVTLGVPRLKELIDTVKYIRTPSMTIRFPHVIARNRDVVTRFAHSLQAVPLSTVVAAMTVVYEPDASRCAAGTEEERIAVAMAAALTPTSSHPRTAGVVARYVLNPYALVSAGLTVTHVARALRSHLRENVEVVAAEPAMREWFLRVRFLGLEKGRGGLAPTLDNLPLLEAATRDIHEELMATVIVHGQRALTRSIVTSERRTTVDPATAATAVVTEFALETEGSALADVLPLRGIDWRRTISNDVHEVFEVLGVEAAAAVLKSEIQGLLSFDGCYVNEHHIKLLVDTMTHGGSLQPMTRHGITKACGSTLMRASFEEAAEVLLEAGAFGNTDRLSGVTENIMLGQPAPVGTALFGLVNAQVQHAGAAAAAAHAVVAPFLPNRRPRPPQTVAPLEFSDAMEEDAPRPPPQRQRQPRTVRPLECDDDNDDAMDVTVAPLWLPPSFVPSSPGYTGFQLMSDMHKPASP